MHSEVRQEEPGRYSECGMALVLASSIKSKVTTKVTTVDDKGLEPLTWRSYLPLITIFALLLTSVIAVSWNQYESGQFLVKNAITYFMAGFFIVFGGFKLMDLKGFVDGYSTYDLLAQRWRGYGYVYPFIEVGFGLLMLLGINSQELLWFEVVVMMGSGIGVVIKLAKGEAFQCACLGTFLKVPLTKITLFEDFGMAALALVLLKLN